MRRLRSSVLLCAAVISLTFGISRDVVAQPQFEFIAEETIIEYNWNGFGSGQVPLFIFQNAGITTEILSWSMSISHDPDLLLVDEIEQGQYTASLNGGAGPEFWDAQVLVEGAVIGSINCTFGCAWSTFETPEEVVLILYETAPLVLAQDLDGELTTLIFEPLGSPPVGNFVNASGADFAGIGVGGLITLQMEPTDLTPFIRGDVNVNGVVEPLADAIFLLCALICFYPMPCQKAADVNDDSGVNIADPIYLLYYGFIGGPPPPPPFPDCGVDPTAGTVLDCIDPPLGTCN